MTATTLLRLCSCIEPDAARLGDRARAARSVDDWPGVAQRAEAHGLAPLTWRFLCAASVSMPEESARVFRALVGRHQHAARVRAGVLREVLDAFDGAGILHVVLKGAALAPMIYPAPGLRPMRDLDLLVLPADAPRAQALLGGLGFQVPSAPPRRFLRWHHHLPAAVRSDEGLRISVEIHRDAFSPDTPESLRLDAAAPTREFQVAGRAARALGHVDMLRHLCGHALEPAREMPLIAVTDIIGYAARFEREVDWALLQARYPAVPNFLSLLHYVSPLPPALGRFRPPENAPRPARVGEGFTPLLSLAVRRAPPGAVMRELLYPSEWWLRASYAVRPGAPVEGVRWCRHVPRLGRWALRRIAAALLPSSLAP